MFALLEAWRAGLLGRRYWISNIVAGLIVGVVALPLAMAFAIASGVKPEQGLYTAIVAGLCVSVFGGSRVQIAGPTGAFIVILADIVATHGVQGLQIATLMAGVILLLFGIARLGAVIRFIPAPVIVGFTAGIGVIIWVGQWKDFLGLPVTLQGHFHQKLWVLVQALPELNVTVTTIGLLSLLLVLAPSRIAYLHKIPGPLIALLAMTVAQALFRFESVPTIGSAFGAIPRELPAFRWLDFDLSRLVQLIGPAFAIAMLGAIESLLSAVVADRMAGTRHRSNQELMGQGVANILAPLFGGFAATGAIARTATNIRNGGNSPIAGIVHALTLMLVILVLAPYAAYVPLATLAAILFVVAWNMSDVPHLIKLLRRAPRADVIILLLTFTLTVFADLVVAVNVGVIMAMLHFLRRMTESVQVHRELSSQATIYRIEGPVFYGVSESFQQVFDVPEGTRELRVIIRLGAVPFMDATGLQALEDVVLHRIRHGAVVVLAEPNARVLAKMKRMGLMGMAGVRFAPNLEAALEIVNGPKKEGP